MYRFFKKACDPMSSFTHFLGIIMGICATIFMSVKAIADERSMITLISIIIFGISLIALYSASTYYHYIPEEPASRKRLFRKLDHAMIYVLIVGTYTPIALYYMPPAKGLQFMGILWGIAIAGILIKVLWLNAPRWLYTMCYLLLGWAVVFDWSSFQSIPAVTLGFIAAGGIVYSIGAVIYILKKPDHPIFGFHEVFHICILLGSLLHILAVLLFVA